MADKTGVDQTVGWMKEQAAKIEQQTQAQNAQAQQQTIQQALWQQQQQSPPKK